MNKNIIFAFWFISFMVLLLKICLLILQLGLFGLAFIIFIVFGDGEISTNGNLTSFWDLLVDLSITYFVWFAFKYTWVKDELFEKEKTTTEPCS